jgi:hypothetical protein
VVLQQTTQELWALQGPFEPYTIHGIAQQNIPEIYIKGTVWNAQSVPARYHARSSAPEESATGTWFPIEFNEEHVCWVEVRWIEPPGSEGYWQAFRIAGEDLGVDITQSNVEVHLQSAALTNYQESIASLHLSRANTPSSPSVIVPRPSPYQPGSRDQEIANTLAESLHINNPMSNTLTTEVLAGTINPHTGHVNADKAALYRAMDQTNRTHQVQEVLNKPHVSHSDGYDHLEEDHQKLEDTSMEEALMDHQQDHSWDTHTTEEVHPEGDHQCPFPQPQSYTEDEMTSW